jgi:DNA-binding NarL/FixJ family response regulator
MEFMRTPQAVTDELYSSESVDRHLEVIEVALDAGDVGAAQRHLRAVRRSLLGGNDSRGRDPSNMLGGVALTGQEVATLRLLPDGSLSQKDIARALGVTRNTLKTHLKSLYLKLGVHCRSEAIHRAREIGLLARPFALVSAPSAPVPDDVADVIYA